MEAKTANWSGTSQLSVTSSSEASRRRGLSPVGSLDYFPFMSDAHQLRETEEFFHEQIPITRAMGVRVAAYDGRQFTLVAPIALNHNHLCTAFGGSLGAVATLAGYGLLWLELRDRACHVVIRQSSLSFRRPVRKDIVAICRRPDQEALQAFKAAFAQRGKARIGLDVTIQEDGLVAVEFQGLFVAFR
jgi:thioesterase domain-containing protein